MVLHAFVKQASILTSSALKHFVVGSNLVVRLLLNRDMVETKSKFVFAPIELANHFEILGDTDSFIRQEHFVSIVNRARCRIFNKLPVV